MLDPIKSIPPARLTRSPFGRLSNHSLVDLYTLETDQLRLGLTCYGARVVSLEVPDRDGNWSDIALGYNSAEAYEVDAKTYLGATIGRFANRLAGGAFRLDSLHCQAPTNNGPNTLHGGTEGFDRRSWTAITAPGTVEFALLSPDGDQGFPGELSVKVAFTVEGPTVRIDYYATTSRTTVLNLTNHSYFNLAGAGSPTILDHVLQLDCDRLIPISADLIPTGEILPVEGTPFDFRQPHPLGQRITAPDTQLQLAGGYDHTFVLTDISNTLRTAARLTEPSSGRTLTVCTTEPAIQIYTGNMLTGEFTGRSGHPLAFRSAVCLETQHFPDSPNHPIFPSTLLEPGSVFRSTTTWTFATF